LVNYSMANDRQNEEVVYIPINENQEPRKNFIKLTVWVAEDLLPLTIPER